MHYDILDKGRQTLLPKLREFRDDFYLAGGTALALQIGHRESIDFDFFRQDSFDTEPLYRRAQESLGPAIQKVREEKDTLTIVADGAIGVSFFGYPYPLIEPLIEEDFIRLASLLDIGCMKLSAITSRAVMKDYVDLFFIINRISLNKLLAAASKKMPTLDRNFVLKALVSFDDVAVEPIMFKEGNETSFPKIKNFLMTQVAQLPLGIQK